MIDMTGMIDGFMQTDTITVINKKMTSGYDPETGNKLDDVVDTIEDVPCCILPADAFKVSQMGLDLNVLEALEVYITDGIQLTHGRQTKDGNVAPSEIILNGDRYVCVHAFNAAGSCQAIVEMRTV